MDIEKNFGLVLVAALALYGLSVVITVYVLDSDDEGSQRLVFFGLLAFAGLVWSFVDDLHRVSKRTKQHT